MTDRVRVRHWKRWLVVGVVAVAAAVVGGPFVYIHFIEGKAPALLTLTPSATSTSDQTTGATQSIQKDGAWKAATGSVVGYRVKEVLFGQSNVAVGRTNSITGSIIVNGTTVASGTFTVDMTTVRSDRSQRDGQFNGRIMDTSTYPTATFTLAQPISLGSIPAQGVARTFQAKGNLTLHGVTRAVTFTVTARYSGSTFQVVGSIPIAFEDWNISNPSFGPVTTEDHGLLEFSLNFIHA